MYKIQCKIQQTPKDDGDIKNKPIISIYLKFTKKENHIKPQYMPSKTPRIKQRPLFASNPSIRHGAPRIQMDDPRLLMRPPGLYAEKKVNFKLFSL